MCLLLILSNKLDLNQETRFYYNRLAPQLSLHASAVSFVPSDVIFARLACPLNEIILVYIGNTYPISLETLGEGSV